MYWGSHFICPPSPYFIPLLSALFIWIGHDHMISIHISFLILHKRESNSNLIFVSKTRWWIFWFWFHQVLEYVENLKLYILNLSFVFLWHDLSGLKLTKLNLKLYYLPKDIKFADEKLNFQQLFSPELPEKKLFKSSFSRWFHLSDNFYHSLSLVDQKFLSFNEDIFRNLTY